MYWAEAVARQSENTEIASKFKVIFDQLSQNEDAIIAELRGVQGVPVDIGGYYHPDANKVSSVMRPSPIFNKIINDI